MCKSMTHFDIIQLLCQPEGPTRGLPHLTQSPGVLRSLVADPIPVGLPQKGADMLDAT